MGKKPFCVVTTVSMVLTLAAVVFALIGAANTGFYPGIVISFLAALIPIASKFYVKKMAGKPDGSRKNYYKTLTIINLLLILIVLWATYVTVHDRVLQDCC